MWSMMMSLLHVEPGPNKVNNPKHQLYFCELLAYTNMSFFMHSSSMLLARFSWSACGSRLATAHADKVFGNVEQLFMCIGTLDLFVGYSHVKTSLVITSPCYILIQF
jgi:hypothetical protein